MGSIVKLATARGFSLKNCGRFTVTFTKYRISASPGKPLRDGGSVCLTCCVGVLATSGTMLENETLVLRLFEIWQELFKGICISGHQLANF